MKTVLPVCFFILSAFTVKAQKSFGISFSDEKPNKIIFVFPGSPAAKAGLLPGDELQQVNEQAISQSTNGAVVQFLSNQPDKSLFNIKRGSLLKTIPVIKEDASVFILKCISGDCNNGKGIYNGNDWSYNGEFKNGKKQGKGTYHWAASGDEYTGGFVNDAREGFGKLIQARGYVYEGGFSFDAYHGNGTLTYPNGDVYTGNFNKDWPEGPGKMIYKNGDIYEGGFSSYQKNGKGLMKFGTGGLYEGDFLNDQQHGKGKMVFANGNVYTGDFTNGNAHGNGILLFGGNKADGKFENNQIVKGKLTTKTGLIADGEFASDGNFKKGTVYYTNGTVATGEFNGENNPVAGKVTYIKGGPVAPAATTTIKTDENFCTELKKLIGYSKNHFRDIKGNVTTRSKAEFTTSYTLTDAIYSYIYEFSEYASMEIQLCKNTAKPGDKNKFQFDCKKDYLSIIRKCMAAESFTEVKQDADGIPGLLFTGNVYLFKNKDNITVKYGMLLHGATINISKDY